MNTGQKCCMIFMALLLVALFFMAGHDLCQPADEKPTSPQEQTQDKDL